VRLCHQRRLEQLSPIPTAANLGELYEHITTGSEHDILPEFILHHRPWASSTETKLHLLGVLFMVAFLTSNVFARFLLSVGKPCSLLATFILVTLLCLIGKLRALR
jgi:hypothetical protein